MIELKSGRKIGAGQEPFIVCEVGSNWRDFEDVKNSIGLAKNCGADAVKFQFFTQKDLYGFNIDSQPGIPPYFHHGWLSGLKQKADAFGIELMCSAFSVDGLKAIDPYVNIHKVASSENNHVRMLEKLRELGKPVLMSTGGSSYADIAKSMCLLHGIDLKTSEVVEKIRYEKPLHVLFYKKDMVIPLYCVSDYPARRVNLKNIEKLKDIYNIAGYSDHTTDVLEVPYCAANICGACVIEKHVNFFDVNSADSPHSINTDEFKAMCSKIKGQSFSESGQTDMITKHNRRLIAIKDIKEGEVFKEGENFGIFRSLKPETEAASPFRIDDVVGKQSKVNIMAGSGIGPRAF